MTDLAGARWSDGEMEAAVEAYADMLGYQQDGMPYKKSDYISRLAAAEIPDRNAGAIPEYMRVISKVLKNMGHHILEGYPPVPKVGANVEKKLGAMLEKRLFPQETYEPTSDPEKLEEQVGALLRRPIVGVPPGHDVPDKQRPTADVFLRDPKICAWVLKEADGVCELCGNRGPFYDQKTDCPFLVVHHVQFLSQGGADSVQNAVALCPNCHAECHYAPNTKVVAEKIRGQVPRIAKKTLQA